MNRSLALLATAICLGACSGGTTSMPSQTPVTMPSQTSMTMAPVQPSAVDFTAFTEKLVTNRSDSAVPTPVTAAEFVFPDNDNLAAFAAVLPAT